MIPDGVGVVGLSDLVQPVPHGLGPGPQLLLHLARCLAVRIKFPVYVEFVILQTHALLRVHFLHVTHELPELLAGDAGPLGQVLRDGDGRLLEQLGVLEDLLSVSELLEGDEGGPTVEHLRAGVHPGGGGDDDVPPDLHVVSDHVFDFSHKLRLPFVDLVGYSIKYQIVLLIDLKVVHFFLNSVKVPNYSREFVMNIL